MITDWTEEQLSRLPKEFENLNEKTIIQRINIQKKEREDERGERQEYYVCKSRLMSTEDYEELIKETEKDNTLIIMSALADIYEKLEGLGGV